MAPRWLLLLLFLHLLPVAGRAQLRVEIISAPEYTPTADSLYLTGSFNDWQPGDERFRFTDLGNGRYAYDFITPVPDFTYKVTRGSWPTVEGGPFGGPIANRQYVHRATARDTVRIRIESWEDMADRIAFLDTLTVVVDRLPENTPEGSMLYVTGNFNDWSPRDPDYRMRLRADSSWVATIPLRSRLTEFKITRGSWASAESRANGLALPNRTYEWSPETPDRELVLTVANWEDLVGSPLGWYGILLLLVALQLAVLAVVLLTIGQRHRLLAALLGLLAIGIASRLGAFDRSIFQAIPKLILLPDLLFFLPAPLLYLYLRGGPIRRADWWHFLPTLIFLVAYLPLLLLDRYAFTSRVVDGGLGTYFDVATGVGVLLSATYWLVAGWLPPAPGFRRGLWWAFLPVLLGWLLTCGTVLLTSASGNWLADLSWGLLGTVPLLVGYWLIRRPDRFRDGDRGRTVFSETLHPASAPPPPNAPSATGTPGPLDKLMSERQPYLNAGLTLAELAQLAGMPAHQLSRILNEEYGQSFFDYVNGYRVDHFTERLRAGAHERQTMLSLGLEAGFNSKSAFNRAFKKKMGQTPRAFLRGVGG